MTPAPVNPTAPWHLDRLPPIVRTSDTRELGDMRTAWTITKYVAAAIVGAILGAIAIGATAGLPPGI